MTMHLLAAIGFLAQALGVPATGFLAQASGIPGVGPFLDFLQGVAILVGICLILFGAWKLHQGDVASGALSLVAGFLCVVAVPLIRTMAGWTGFNF
jgi:hypothetical protein